MMHRYEDALKKSLLSESVMAIGGSLCCSNAKAGTSTPNESIAFTVKRIYTSGANGQNDEGLPLTATNALM